MLNDQSHDSIDRKILQFWIENPSAKGTPQVIADWWLPKNGESLSDLQVRESLDRLTLKGWIVERELSHVFRLNELKLKEIREFLEQIVSREEESEEESSESTVHEPKARLSLLGLMPALQRLDRLIQKAVQAMRATQGPDAVAETFRGLHISPEEVKQLLIQTPGESSLRFNEETASEGEEGSRECQQLIWLEQYYGLSSLERDIVLVALAPELDLKYERLYAYLQDDVSKKRPTVDLALNLLTASGEDKLIARKYFAPESPLIGCHLIELIPDPHQIRPPLLAHIIKLDDQIVNLLLGQATQDSHLSAICKRFEPVSDWSDPPIREDLYLSLQALIRETKQNSATLWLYFMGEKGNGQQETVRAIANEMSVPVLVVDVEAVLRHGQHEIEKTIARICREACSTDAILYFEWIDAIRIGEHLAAFHRMMDALKDFASVAVLSGSHVWKRDGHGPDGILTILFDIPDYEQRRLLWKAQIIERHLDPGSTDLTVEDIDMLADRFQLTADEIAESFATASQVCQWKQMQESDKGNYSMKSVPHAKELFTAVREQCGYELKALAKKVNPIHSWDNLIFPSSSMDQLHEICAQVVHRRQVLDTWGFGRTLSLGKGLSALFAGPSGTGKTTAAEIIANELQQDLYKIDLSRVVSKYIGETEKNLEQVFRAAKRSNAILFFDEADALWGKRSEVKDSHDRYANLEIAYLLQKMDEYEGVAILATNLRRNMDDAFIRRLQFIVEFPFPTESERRAIWKLFLEPESDSISQADRFVEGREIDYGWLARNIRLPGGNIKNIVLAAAYLAAAEKKGKQQIGMKHLLRAIRRECQKMGKELPESEIAAYEEKLEAERQDAGAASSAR